MLFIVGLGNPGAEYERTPHTIGFRVLDYLRDTYFSDRSWQTKYHSNIIEATIGRKKIILCKPLTFMNSSGVAVASLMNFYKVQDFYNLWIVHDELDLPWGRIKVDLAKSSAGHKGIQSVIDAIGTMSFWRFRVGVRPEFYPDAKEEIDRYLTRSQVPKKNEAMILERASELIITSVREGIKSRDISIAI